LVSALAEGFCGDLYGGETPDCESKSPLSDTRNIFPNLFLPRLLVAGNAAFPGRKRRIMEKVRDSPLYQGYLSFS